MKLQLITTLAAIAVFGLGAAGCKPSGSTTNQSGNGAETKPAPSTAQNHDHDHDHADGHAHDHGDGHSHEDDHADGGAGHGGPVIELGKATIGAFSVRASRDQGDIKPGGDAPIDVWLTSAGDDATVAQVTAVRFWIGTESGDGSVKAKAAIENPAEPNHFHTHVEVPNPIPADSRLWVEVEIAGQKLVGSFDLKS